MNIHTFVQNNNGSSKDGITMYMYIPIRVALRCRTLGHCRCASRLYTSTLVDNACVGLCWSSTLGHELTAKLITRGRNFADNVFMKEGSFLSETPLVCLKSGFAPPNAARLKMSTLAILQKSEKITTVLQISYKLCYGHLQATKIMPPGH